MKRIGAIGLFVLALGLVSVARAEEKLSIKEKDQRKADLEELKESTNNADSYCGTKLEADISWSSFKGVNRGDHSLPNYCAEPFSALGNLCYSSESAKASISKDVKKVVCAFGGKGKRAVALKDGVLTWTIDWDATDNGDFLKNWLENNL